MVYFRHSACTAFCLATDITWVKGSVSQRCNWVWCTVIGEIRSFGSIGHTMGGRRMKDVSRVEINMRRDMFRHLLRVVASRNSYHLL